MLDRGEKILRDFIQELDPPKWVRDIVVNDTYVAKIKWHVIFIRGHKHYWLFEGMRKTCSECAVEQTPDDELLAASGLTREQVQGFTFKVGRGCGHCRGTGYQGRKAIAEILLVNDEIREMILRGEPVRRLREVAAANGTHSLRESALECVRRGEITLQEINRVTFVA